MIAVIAALTMTVGNLLALRQRHAVRLLAWSSVAQSGYILAPLAASPDRTAPPRRAMRASAGSPVIGPAAVHRVPGLLRGDEHRGVRGGHARAGRSARNELDDYRGLAVQNPAAGLALAFFLICLAGLPPGLAGLFAKIVVFREIARRRGGWLAVVMAVNTVIGLDYYVAWTARIFTPARSRPQAVTPGRSAALGGGAALTVAVTLGVLRASRRRCSPWPG